MDVSYDQPCDGDLFVSDDLSARVDGKEGCWSGFMSAIVHNASLISSTA